MAGTKFLSCSYCSISDSTYFPARLYPPPPSERALTPLKASKHNVGTLMRLLDTFTGRFVEKDPRKEKFLYAILSHTWDSKGEQTYQELKKIQEEHFASSSLEGSNFEDLQRLLNAIVWDDDPNTPPLLPLSTIWDDSKLSPKIRDACAVARKHCLRYIWIDSCCIDKTSSSELSEAINSMYLWYQGAIVCYAYLADVSPLQDEDPWKHGSSFRGSRWFKRGWTLQELIAPKRLKFLSKDWTVLGWKGAFAELVSAITGIGVDALSQKAPLYSFSVAQRFSWAAGRETTRVEDRAYSLLGIFDISMPTLYGEGEGAFQRLQEEILRRIPDQSVFAWGNVYLLPQVLDLHNLNPTLHFTFRRDSGHSRSLLASSPDDFFGSGSITVAPEALAHLFYHYPQLPIPEYSFTPHGVRANFPLIPLMVLPGPGVTCCQLEPSEFEWYLAVLGCEHADRPGHLLGRVCCVSPASSSHILSGGDIMAQEDSSSFEKVELVTLSPEILALSSVQARVFPVHLYSDRHAIMPLASNENVLGHPHKALHLLLKKSGSPVHRSASDVGVFSDVHAERRRRCDDATTLTLRWPDRAHPNTHQLTLSPSAAQETVNIQDTITIEFTHTLVVCVSGTLRGHPIVPVDAITWTDGPPWGLHWWTHKRESRWKEHETIWLSNGEGSTVELEFSLDFFSPNYYLVDAHADWFNSSRLNLEEDNGSDSE